MEHVGISNIQISMVLDNNRFVSHLKISNKSGQGLVFLEEDMHEDQID